MRTLFNDGWTFLEMPVGTGLAAARRAQEAGRFGRVEIPHDWLIDDCHDFYRDGTGWYRKDFLWQEGDGIRTDTDARVCAAEAAVPSDDACADIDARVCAAETVVPFDDVNADIDARVCAAETAVPSDEALVNTDAPQRVFLIFDGVYMNSSYFLNGKEVYAWKNGYTRCTFEITPFLQEGVNELMVSVTFEAPNSRWYSGAGIERNVWLMTTGRACIPDGGIYVSTKRTSDDGWDLGIQTKVCNPDREAVRIRTAVYDGDRELLPERILSRKLSDTAQDGVRAADNKGEDSEAVPAEKEEDSEAVAADMKEEDSEAIGQILHFRAEDITLWDVENPKRYRLEVQLLCDSRDTEQTSVPGVMSASRACGLQDAERTLRTKAQDGAVWDEEDVMRPDAERIPQQTEELFIGFRSTRFDPDRGFFLNGRHVKLQGVCLHTDHGALGNAFHIEALRRQLRIMKEMGVNAVRFAHNPFAAEALDLTDAMGLLVIDECLDMWEMPKNRYDYSRYFDEWQARDVESFVRRDRNHPSVILWSIGNEIYDQHAGGERGVELTRMLMEEVFSFDPMHNALVTTGSNYMPWENAQRCADVYRIVGYNYAEKYYAAHHEAHPDWAIYGSETCSICSSRGIYHFPLETEILSDEDEQCSALGNSITSWGARSVEECVCGDRDLPYSMGQFLWAGMDYLGEPTPYHTKNSYLGMVDTAGFPKDLYYVWQSAWTDVREHPMVHVFPYWDFSRGQEIDVRVCSNAPEVELFLNGVSLGRQTLDHAPGSGTHVIADWKVNYEPGFIAALAYDNGVQVASEIHRSFGDTAAFTIRKDPEMSGRLRFYEIQAVDAQGRPVENAMDFVRVEVSGARLLGLDNGDSTDRYPFRGNERHLFSGKLLAIVEIPDPGEESAPSRRAASSGAEIPDREEEGLSSNMAACPGAGQMRLSAQFAGYPDAGQALLSTWSAVNPDAGQARQSARPAVNPDAGQALLSAQAERYPEIVTGTAYEKAPSCDVVDEEGIRIAVVGLQPVAVRKICVEALDGCLFTPERKVLRARAYVEPAQAEDHCVVFSAVDDRGVPVNIVDLEQEGAFVTMTAKGDGSFHLRCTSESGSGHIRIISQVEYRIEGLGPAYLDPYGFISASLYTGAQGEVGCGNEKGIATARDGDTTVTWSGMDFGPVGSDTVTIPIFALTGEEYPMEIWEGTPGEEGAQLLLEAVYCKPSMWNVYQPETFVLPKRLTGMASFSIRVHRKMHIKGFTFARCEKAWTRLYASDANEVYGDSFRKDGPALRRIGNNVSLLYHDMTFAQHPLHGIRVCGFTPLAVNTIHLRFQNDLGEEREILEFRGESADAQIQTAETQVQAADTQTCGVAHGPAGGDAADAHKACVQEFALQERTGSWTMTFVFLPGSNYDLEWFELF